MKRSKPNLDEFFNHSLQCVRRDFALVLNEWQETAQKKTEGAYDRAAAVSTAEGSSTAPLSIVLDYPDEGMRETT